MTVISGNHWVPPCFMQKLKATQPEAQERAVSAHRRCAPRQRCCGRPGCQNSSVSLQRLQVVIAFQVVDLRSDVFRTVNEGGEVEKKTN